MIRSSSNVLAVIAAAAAISVGSSAKAGDVVVEAPLATRIVQVSPADLASPDRLSALHSRLRSAVIDTCKEEYGNPTGMIYYYVRACYTGSLRDALGQLREIQARQLAQHDGADAKIAISILPK